MPSWPTSWIIRFHPQRPNLQNKLLITDCLPDIKQERSEHSQSRQLSNIPSVTLHETQAPDPTAEGHVSVLGTQTLHFQPGGEHLSVVSTRDGK